MLDWIIKGGPVMYPLLACSLVSLTFIFERAIFWTRERKRRNRKRIEDVLCSIEQGDYEQAYALTQNSHDPIVRIFGFGIVHHHLSLEGALQMAAGNEIIRMRRFLPALDTIVTIAPLLGILGTVMGIIHSFNVLGDGGIDNPMAVTGGIAEALLTTAFGLIIAVLTLIPYNYFNSQLEQAIVEMENHLTNFEIMYKKGRSPDQQRPRVQSDRAVSGAPVSIVSPAPPAPHNPESRGV